MGGGTYTQKHFGTDVPQTLTVPISLHNEVYLFYVYFQIFLQWTEKNKDK